MGPENVLVDIGPNKVTVKEWNDRREDLFQEDKKRTGEQKSSRYVSWETKRDREDLTLNGRMNTWISVELSHSFNARCNEEAGKYEVNFGVANTSGEPFALICADINLLIIPGQLHNQDLICFYISFFTSQHINSKKMLYG